MARTTLTPKAAPGSYPSLQPAADSLDLTMTAADIANYNQFKATGKDLIFLHNSGASPYTVTLSSAPDSFLRSGDITTYSLAAGDYAVIGPLALVGWAQADGYVYLQASNAAVKIGIVSL